MSPRWIAAFVALCAALPGLAVGIARSDDLTNWTKVGEMRPEAEHETRGLAAPAAMVLRLSAASARHSPGLSGRTIPSAGAIPARVELFLNR